MSAGSFAQNLLLQYGLIGATATRVTAWSVGLSLGSPKEGTLSEIAAGSGYVRQPIGFASSVANTFTNSAAVSFAAFSSNATVSGIFVVNNAGSLLLYGTLSPATAIARGSIGVIASGALKVALN
jgi:hypothetical protein